MLILFLPAGRGGGEVDGVPGADGGSTRPAGRKLTRPAEGIRACGGERAGILDAGRVHVKCAGNDDHRHDGAARMASASWCTMHQMGRSAAGTACACGADQHGPGLIVARTTRPSPLPAQTHRPLQNGRAPGATGFWLHRYHAGHSAVPSWAPSIAAGGKWRPCASALIAQVVMQDTPADQAEVGAPVKTLQEDADREPVERRCRRGPDLHGARSLVALVQVDVGEVARGQLPDGRAAVDVVDNLEVDVGDQVDAAAEPLEAARGGLVLHGPGEDLKAAVTYPPDMQVADGLHDDLVHALGLPVKLTPAGHSAVALDPEVRRVRALHGTVAVLVAGGHHDVALVDVPAHARHVPPPGHLD